MKAKWGNKGVEPEWVARLGRGANGDTASAPSQENSAMSSAGASDGAGAAPSFSFDPTAAIGGASAPSAHPMSSTEDYESSTLLRMRQAERERLEREIREEEMEDGE